MQTYIILSVELVAKETLFRQSTSSVGPEDYVGKNERILVRRIKQMKNDNGEKNKRLTYGKHSNL